MDSLNYDLLKLAKILPSIKGKRILDIYQESLDRARLARQMEDEAEETGELETNRGKDNSVKAQLRKLKMARGKHVKSTHKLQTEKLNEAIEGFSNLKKLLHQEEDEDNLASMFYDESRERAKKMQREQSEGRNIGKLGHMSTQSNFVFKKRKAYLRGDEEYASFNGTNNGFGNYRSNLIGLNGHKVNVNDYGNGNITQGQGRSWKNLKLNPVGGSHSHQDVHPMNGKFSSQSTTNHRVSDVREQRYYSGQKNKPGSRLNKVNLDGAQLQPIDARKVGSTSLTPIVSMKGAL